MSRAKKEKPGKNEELKKKVKLISILDMSGSMYSLTDDTIGGYNALIDKQKEDKEEEVYATLILFNTAREIVYQNALIDGVKPLDRTVYIPGGCTALLDAIGQTLVDFKLDEDETCLCFITTDGFENASKEYDYAGIKKMIEDKKATGKWEFMFVGANIDAVAEAAKFGIKSDRAAKYTASKAGTASLYETVSKTAMKYRKSGKIDEKWDEDLV